MPVVSLGKIIPDYNIIDNLDDDSSKSVLSANQGRILNELLTQYKQTGMSRYYHQFDDSNTTHTFSGDSKIGYCKCTGTYHTNDIIKVNDTIIRYVVKPETIQTGTYIFFIVDNSSLIIFSNTHSSKAIPDASDPVLDSIKNNYSEDTITTWIKCAGLDIAEYPNVTTLEAVLQHEDLYQKLINSENARHFFITSPDLIKPLLKDPNNKIIKYLDGLPVNVNFYRRSPNMESMNYQNFYIINGSAQNDTSSTGYHPNGAWCSPGSGWRSTYLAAGIDVDKDWTEIIFPYPIWPYKIVGKTGRYNNSTTSKYQWQVFDEGSGSWSNLCAEPFLASPSVNAIHYNTSGYNKKAQRFRIRIISKNGVKTCASAEDNYIFGIM